MLTSICLLAGFSSRMGRPKQHLSLGQETFLQRITRVLQENRHFLANQILVGQAGDSVSQLLATKHGCLWVNNPHPEDGPLSSIKLASEIIPAESAILLWPVDHPLVSSETVKNICLHHLKHPDGIIVPSTGTHRGHPAIFPANLRPELFNIPEGEGAKRLLQLYPERIVHVLCDDIWVCRNLNTPQRLEEALQLLKNQS